LESMKIIFLDIDGVVTSARDNGFRDFNLHVIHWLRFLCQESGAKIVISSTWRHSHGKEFWQTIFGEYLHEDWRTPDCGGTAIRGDEINQWVQEQTVPVKVLIIDDDSDFHDYQKKGFIKTDPMNGMLFESFMQLRDLLEVDVFPKYDAEIYQHPNMFGTTRLIKMKNPGIDRGGEGTNESDVISLTRVIVSPQHQKS